MDEVIEFLKLHKDVYNIYFENNRLSKCYYGYTCDINQIYCYLNLIDINETEYYTFYNLSKKYFNLNNIKILEVACGYIPILSSIYKNNNFDIDALNNKIVIDNYNNIKTIECDLTDKFNLEKYDLIIGFRPCDTTEQILDLCYFYNKDFMIYLCPCIHNPINKEITFSTYKEWLNYLKNKLNNFKNYNIDIFSDKDLPDDCPVIIGKSLKK